MGAVIPHLREYFVLNLITAHGLLNEVDKALQLTFSRFSPPLPPSSPRTGKGYPPQFQQIPTFEEGPMMMLFLQAFLFLLLKTGESDKALAVVAHYRDVIVANTFRRHFGGQEASN